MGITNLNPFLKERCPKTFNKISLVDLAFTRVGIDGNNWAYVNRAIAQKKVINLTDVSMEDPDSMAIDKQWFNSLLNFICVWLNYCITPCFIFDGIPLKEKDDTREKRNEARLKAEHDVNALKDELASLDLLEKPTDKIIELRKLMCRSIKVEKGEIEMMKIVLRSIGIPFITALHDGEQLGSFLCMEGKISAFYSTDTDCLAYGCPLILNRFDRMTYKDEEGKKVHYCEVSMIQPALKGLSMNQTQFIDLCIMSGCDFNKNIHGTGIGKSYPLLMRYGNIETIREKEGKDISCLNVEKCRNIFRQKPSIQCIQEGSKLELDIFNPFRDIERSIDTRDTLDTLGLGNFLSRLRDFYSVLEKKRKPIEEDQRINLVRLGLVEDPNIVKLKIISPSTQSRPILKLVTPDTGLTSN